MTPTIIKYIIHDVIMEAISNNSEQDKIEPTLELVKQKYNEFNELYFDGFLPKCIIRVKPIMEQVGLITAGNFRFAGYSNAILINGANLFYDPKKDCYGKLNVDTVYSALKPTITINSKYKTTLSALENTIIHEMCHYYTHFNEDGSFRLSDEENKHHGQDFINAAEMISRKSGGKVKITAVLNAEEIENLSASSYFEDDDVKICLADYDNGKVFWFTKYHSIWVKFMYSMLKTDTIDITTDPQVLMLLKRYGYRITSWRNNKPNAYMLDKAPKALVDAFNNARFITVKEGEYHKFFNK